MKGDRKMTAAYEIMELEGDDFYDGMVKKVVPFLKKKRQKGYFGSYDDTRIYYEAYVNEEEKASIVIAHGFCEFSHKYEEVIYNFFKEGYSVFIMDHRGHGFSARKVDDMSKVYVKSFDEYVEDVRVFTEKVVMPVSKTDSMFMYAHSMGGAIGALLLEKYPELFKCAVLSSPMLEINFGKMSDRAVDFAAKASKILRTGKKYAPGQSAFDGTGREITNDTRISKARYDYFFQKRLNHKRYQTSGATNRWSCAGIDAVKKIQKNLENVCVPVLLFQAGLDTVVKPGGQNLFAENTSFTELVVMEDSEHEIYNSNLEIRREYYKRIFDFYSSMETA